MFQVVEALQAGEKSIVSRSEIERGKTQAFWTAWIHPAAEFDGNLNYG
jgi:type IV secretory pathway VirD2 relaxase